MVVILNTFVVTGLITASERMASSVEMLYAGEVPSDTRKALVHSVMRIIRVQTGNRRISSLYCYESFITY